MNTNNNQIDDLCVILADIGARGGIHDRWSEFKDHLHAILFEPDAQAEITPDDEQEINHTIIPIALGKATGEATLNICKAPSTSSVYEPNSAFIRLWRDSDSITVVDRVKVPLSTLDIEMQKYGFPRIDFLKLDTQGSELDILEGGVAALKGAIGLEVEVEFSEIYSGQPLFCDVDRFLRSQGFDLYDIVTTYSDTYGGSYWSCASKKVKRDSWDKGKLMWADVVYFKPPDEILRISKKDSNYLARAVFCYLAYGYVRVAWYCVETAASQGIISPQEFQKLSDFIISWEKCHQNDIKPIKNPAVTTWE